MTVNQIKAGLQRLKGSFRRILEDDADHIIEDAIAELESSKRRFDGRIGRTDDPRLKPEDWGYRIYPERPLRFKRSSAIKGLDLWIDLYCTVLWKKEGEMPVNQEIHLRVWSDTSNTYTYRSEWDSENVLDKLTNPAFPLNRRVMFRCHFDLANPGQSGPKYHLQCGGEPREDELCWFPGILDLPRLACPPMDLILTCQLIAANFYWEEYGNFREDPEWVNTLRRSEKHLLKNYYEKCFRTIEQGHEVLDCLWNV
jgi:hypothetical protein